MASPTSLDPATLKRLTFVRLLHQQGIDQSRLPEPLSFTSILSFHDAVEHFLVLAGEHLNASLPKRMDFLQYWSELSKDTQPTPVLLSGRTAMDRLNRIHVNFKHVGALPGPQAVEDARSDVRSFFEENTTKVFAVDFNSIEMADLIPQQPTRDRARKAASTYRRGDIFAAMVQLAIALDELLGQHVAPKRRPLMPFGFGAKIRRQMPVRNILAVFNRTLDQKAFKTDPHDLHLAEQISDVTAVTAQAQAGLRIVALGIDYYQYVRFQRLVPHVTPMLDGSWEAFREEGYAPNQQEFDFCTQFLVRAGLRLAEVETAVFAQSWRPPSDDEIFADPIQGELVQIEDDA